MKSHPGHLKLVRSLRISDDRSDGATGPERFADDEAAGTSGGTEDNEMSRVASHVRFGSSGVVE